MRLASIVFIVALLAISILSAYADGAQEKVGDIKFCGALEGEMGYNVLDDNQNSDFALAKAELGVDASFGEKVAGKILLLYEQGENNNNVIVDEGAISLKFPITFPIELSLGRIAVPFGEFNSHFATDPYTQEIYEKKQAGLLASANFHDIANLSFAVYNDETIIDEDNDHIKDVASKLSFHLSEGNLGLSFGGSFITNIVGTDGVNEIIGDNTPLERATGLESFASLSMMGAFLEFEYIAALEDIKLKGENKIKPQAFNIELGYSIPNTPIEFAGKFERYSEGGNNPVDRFGGVVSFGLFNDMASLALEFLRTNKEDSSENSITGQLNIGF